jgi:hypothetical protein
MERAQACYNFCLYNKARTDEYRAAAKEVSALGSKNGNEAKLKTLADRGSRYAGEAEKFWTEENEKFRKDVAAMAPKYPELIPPQDVEKVNLDGEYFKRLKEYFVKVYDNWAEKDNSKALSMISRAHWTTPGGMLDGMVYYQRKTLQRLGQEVTLAGVETPEACALAFTMRGLLQKALRAPHYKEEPLPAEQAFKGGR